MIKIGLLGAGFMGSMHAACYQALSKLGVLVTAVADDSNVRAEKLAAISGAEVYTSGMELIEKADADVIDICLSTNLHAAHAVAAMKKGRAVFCEKPVCIREDEMELLLQTQKEIGAKVMIGQVIRFWPEYVWLKKTVDAGTYGKVLSGVFQRVSSRPVWAYQNWLHTPELSGGVAVDMHVHDVDFVRYLLGEPDRVQAAAYRDTSGLIEQIFAVYNYGARTAVSIEAGWDFPAMFPFTASYRVKMEKATAVLDGNGLTLYPDEGEVFHPELDVQFEAENNIGGNVSSLGGYYNELKYFVEGLQGKNDLSIATLAEAVASVRLVKREIESAGGLVVK